MGTAPFFYQHFGCTQFDFAGLARFFALAALLAFLSSRAGKRRWALWVLTGLYTLSVSIYLVIELRGLELTSDLLIFLAVSLPVLLGFCALLAALALGGLFWRKESRFYRLFCPIMLAAVGGFLRFMGWEELRVKPLKIQRSPFCDEERELTRAEYARQGGYSTAQGGMAIRKYVDYDAISRYALEAMDWANAAGILNGTSATTLAPQGQAARAQAAAMLTRLCQTVVQEV